MDEYIQNIEDYDLFNYLTFHQDQQFQFEASLSHPAPYSPQNLQPPPKYTHPQKDIPTADQCHAQPPPQHRLLSPAAERRRNWIELQGGDAVQRRKSVLQGSKDDTVELNTNFRTIIYNHLKDLLFANEISPREAHRVLSFGKRSPSFKSLLDLTHPLQGTEARQLCLRLISSSMLLSRIMGSRCQMGTKLQMIKFVERLRLNILSGKVVKWKAPLGR